MEVVYGEERRMQEFCAVVLMCLTVPAAARIHTVEHEAEINRDAQGCQGE